MTKTTNTPVHFQMKDPRNVHGPFIIACNGMRYGDRKTTAAKHVTCKACMLAAESILKAVR